MSHVVQRHGRVRLPVVTEPLLADAVGFAPVAGVPAGGRDECKGGCRPCPYVRCKWHLWLELGADRPGRRWHGRNPPTTLRPLWLTSPMPPSCALDVADRASDGHVPTVGDLAAMLGIRESQAFFLLAVAFEKLGVTGAPLREFMQPEPPRAGAPTTGRRMRVG